jgi:hypothetical protein
LDVLAHLFRPRPIARPIAGGPGVIVRPSFKQLHIFAATIGPVAIGALGISWVFGESPFTTTESVALGFACVIIFGIFLVALFARTHIRAGSTGLEIADGIGRSSVIPWAGIQELTVDTSNGLLRVGLVEGKDSTFEVPFLTGADAPAAARSLMQACDAFMSSGRAPP